MCTWTATKGFTIFFHMPAPFTIEGLLYAINNRKTLSWFFSGSNTGVNSMCCSVRSTVLRLSSASGLTRREMVMGACMNGVILVLLLLLLLLDDDDDEMSVVVMIGLWYEGGMGQKWWRGD